MKVNRREFLGWMTASLAGAASASRCGTPGDESDIFYHYLRIPRTGELALTLDGGGVLRCYVWVEYDTPYPDEPAWADACARVLGQYTYPELSYLLETTATPNRYAYRSVEEELEQAIQALPVAYSPYYWLRTDLTIVSLTA